MPKAVREAAGIRPGDRVSVRARPEGGILVERSQERQPDAAAVRAARDKIERALATLDRKGVKFEMTTDEWMRLLRGDD